MIAFLLKIIFFPIYILIYIFMFITKNIGPILILLFEILHLIILFSWNCIKYIYKFTRWLITKIKENNLKKKSKKNYSNKHKQIINNYNQQNINNKENLNKNILSNETKICDSNKVERKLESNKNPNYKLEINQYDSVMYDHNDMKKEYINIYYGNHNSAKLNNLIYNETEIINTINNKKIDNIYEFTHLVLYLNKQNNELIKNNEINYKLLGIDKINFPYLCIDEYDEDTNNKYIKFIDDDYTSKDYSEAIYKILEYCKNDTYITLGYDYESYKYKFLYKDEKIILENYNLENFHNDLNTLKQSITNNYNIISKYMFNIKMEDIEIPYNPQPDIHYEDIKELINKFKKIMNLK